ncbi:hypothetical protein MJM04_29035, partial [Salmonella enterica subsp. enterica serovar Cerro]|nr:hypothetical protein [Salmonella enterica subsp. enterica serovar Cerro]
DGHDCGRRRRYAQHRLTPKESRPHAVMWGRHEILLSSSSFFQTFDSPKFIGLPVGEVLNVAKDYLDVEATEPLANGDGLNVLIKR